MPAETLYAIFSAVATGLVLKLGDWLINRSKDGREVRKDLREEISELWDHSDNQDAKIKALQDQLAVKDQTISDLRQAIEKDEIYWKQRFTAENIEKQMLVRKLDDMQKHIELLERQIKELQK